VRAPATAATPVAGPLLTAWRSLFALAAIAYLAAGIPLFFTPSWASDHFAWQVSPFVAMTAGAWCLGTAVWAGWAIFDHRGWAPIRPCVVYVLAFGTTELGVALYESDLLRTDVVLAWPYLAALGLSVVGGVLAVVDGGRHLGPDRRPGGVPVPRIMQQLDVVFVAFVGSSPPSPSGPRSGPPTAPSSRSRSRCSRCGRSASSTCPSGWASGSSSATAGPTPTS
jgi:hypothetical protein